MESHEVLKKAVTEIGVKAVAADMNLSSSLIYKWCEAKDTPDAGGADNPLDRLHKIYEITGDTRPISWLCERAEGFFVQNPPPVVSARKSILPATRRILREFTDVLDAVSESVEDDGKIDPEEASRIRTEWEELKSITESFVLGCEKGHYDKDTGKS